MTAHPLFDIGGRTALVTGSSRGIGLALARGLAEAGCTVVLNKDSDWHRILDTNLTSAFLVSREAARRMTRRGHGKIINICSLQSEVVRPGIAPYAATKGALKMLTKGMCADWGPHGVQVNGLGPGYIETELTRPLVEDEEFSAWVRRRTPAGRWGRTEDLVGGLLFLASAAADFIGGQVLYVDGGMTSVL
jgi:gluconate 5-dehydrogenase